MTDIIDPTKVVARNVRSLRMRRRWSAQRLADELAGTCAPLTRATIANIELGRRAVITVTELAALGQVFGMPPWELTAEIPADPWCTACEGEPPAGFTCNHCGTGGQS